uniref:Uncharacterized protein n=1 Tax=Rhizophora mucronata TaxID=61149 RepID=A0A2P2N5V5_RHIMU
MYTKLPYHDMSGERLDVGKGSKQGKRNQVAK